MNAQQNNPADRIQVVSVTRIELAEQPCFAVVLKDSKSGEEFLAVSGAGVVPLGVVPEMSMIKKFIAAK